VKENMAVSSNPKGCNNGTLHLGGRRKLDKASEEIQIPRASPKKREVTGREESDTWVSSKCD